MTLLEMSIYGAVIILAVLILRVFTLHKLPKKTFLILWGIALLRLLVPFEIESGFSIYSLLPKDIAALFSEASADSGTLPENSSPDGFPVNAFQSNTFFPEENPMPNQKNTAASDSSVENSGVIALPNDTSNVQAMQLPTPDSGEDTLTAAQPSEEQLYSHPFRLIWMAGFLGSTIFFLITYIKCHREFHTSLPVTNEYLLNWRKHHWTNRNIKLRQSDKISAPLTYGLFRPVILLPKNMDWEDTRELDYILYHEFTHIRRFDLLWKLMMTAALCIHWFNPFVWLMYFFFNRDLELSCDECVVKHYEEDTRASYAGTLIHMEEKKSPMTPLCSNFSKTAMEERITAIMKSKKNTTGMIVAGVIIVATVIITLTTSAAKKPASNPADLPEGTPTPTMMPFTDIDFSSGDTAIHPDWQIPLFPERELQDNGSTMTMALFSSYQDMQNMLFRTGLSHDNNDVTLHGVEGYRKVTDDRFPSLQNVMAYMETICTPEHAKILADNFLLLGGDHPFLAEQNGELYTISYTSHTEDLSYRFVRMEYDQQDTFTIEYHGYIDTPVNVVKSGIITIQYHDGAWRIASDDSIYGNPYFADYNGEKLQRIASCDEDNYSPTICNDIIFYRADEEETLDEVLAAMKTAILDILTVPDTYSDGLRMFTVTDYDVSTQRYTTIDMKNRTAIHWDHGAWILPALDGWYSFEGCDLVSMEERLKEGVTDEKGRVPFLAVGSDDIFTFILLKEGNVYRLQREAAANRMIEDGWTMDSGRLLPTYRTHSMTYPVLAENEAVVAGKGWNLAFRNQIHYPRYSELLAGGAQETYESLDEWGYDEWYTLTLDGICHFFYTIQNDSHAWNIAITTPDYPLSGGAKVGMTEQELLTLYPDLAKTALNWDDSSFSARYGNLFSFRDDLFPESFLANYDYAYTAYLEKDQDGLPICIAFLMQDDMVAAITVYMPTAG
ncbi:MAG: M56 family metallopeptidase [Lachnospiraceae bacterium]|nr:M56 family metallopeptidase [Lachnospiraceae bacterium]